MTLPKRADDAQQTTSIPRRNFLRNSILLALPAIAAAGPLAASVSMALPSELSSSAFVPPRRPRGTKVLNVRDYGARGDGSTDDTTAFQNAIDALGTAGGTLDVPEGTYVIDALRSVKLRSKMHLRLASNATLKAKRNSEEWSQVISVLRVSDVEISGGQIIGERDAHIGTTGQWGHGIMVRGSSRVTIRDLLVRKCWGDGVYIGMSFRSGSIASKQSTDVVVANIVSTDNRRQAMSIGQVSNVKVYDSELSHTNGRKPGCGIDIEPDPNMSGTAVTVRIENCWIHSNEGNGIQVYKDCRQTVIKGCNIEKNYGYGVLAIGAISGTIGSNTFTSNGLNAVGIRSGSSNYAVSGNSFYNNYNRNRSTPLVRVSPPKSRSGHFHERCTQISGSSGITVGTNKYFDK